MFLKSDIPTILKTIEALQPAPDETLLLLFAENDTPDIPQLINALNQRNISFMGGIFPGIIHGKQQETTGCLLKKFKTLVAPFMVRNISTFEYSGIPETPAGPALKNSTALLLVDGLTPNIYGFLEQINDKYGAQCRFIGGGAGSMSLRQAPCVFNREGFFADAATVCIIPNQACISVRHGWTKLAGPLVATHTEGNTIYQLNWTRAFDVYRAIVEADAGIELTETNFMNIAQGYPFGILRDKAEDIVRDPLAIGPDGEIICIGEVKPNTVLHVLKGEVNSLLDAAYEVITDCIQQGGGDTRLATGSFVVDCITRTMFLNDAFDHEIDIIRTQLDITHAEQEPFGILSLGEISSYHEGLLELFNKTIVVGVFH